MVFCYRPGGIIQATVVEGKVGDVPPRPEDVVQKVGHRRICVEGCMLVIMRRLKSTRLATLLTCMKGDADSLLFSAVDPRCSRYFALGSAVCSADYHSWEVPGYTCPASYRGGKAKLSYSRHLFGLICHALITISSNKSTQHIRINTYESRILIKKQPYRCVCDTKQTANPLQTFQMIPSCGVWVK